MGFFEINELLRESIIASMTATSLYLTVVTGYLVVAYIAGEELTKFQQTLITTLFVSSSLFFAFISFMFLSRAASYGGGDESTSRLVQLAAYWIGSIQLLGIIGSLIFMYQVQKK
ncbi:MAG TPA: hypothetical protein DCM64_07125 [Gammaproteobacteria bacterium]|jgi:hypothetical protein|nr:hypothetical protein [Gammaproteobacteria bacterium]|tara:strand:+ start:2667 stop:3011 length:345 start_codon:yes stop_codon:yes gene_type:complete